MTLGPEGSFAEVSIEWSATAEKNDVKNFRKEAGTFKLFNGEAQKVSLVVDANGKVSWLLDSRSSGSFMSLREARLFLFAIDSRDECVASYMKKVSERDQAKKDADKKKNDLFK